MPKREADVEGRTGREGGEALCVFGDGLLVRSRTRAGIRVRGSASLLAPPRVNYPSFAGAGAISRQCVFGRARELRAGWVAFRERASCKIRLLFCVDEPPPMRVWRVAAVRILVEGLAGFAAFATRMTPPRQDCRASVWIECPPAPLQRLVSLH